MIERIGEPGAVFELVYANGQCAEVVLAIDGDELPEPGSEERLELLDLQQELIERQLAKIGLAEALEDQELNGHFVRQNSREMTKDEVAQLNQESILRDIQAAEAEKAIA